MSLCCFKLKCSKSLKSNSKNDGIVQENVDNHNNQKSLGIDKSPDNDNNIQTEVKMRLEPVRQKQIFSQPDPDIYRNSSMQKEKSKPPTRSNSTLVKSVIHKNLRFDENTVDTLKPSNKIDKNRKPFIAASRRGSLYIFRAADDVIITPFAQILASLHKVRANFMLISKAGTESNEKLSKTEESSEEPAAFENNLKEEKIAHETLKELEWCLDRLESIQTYRSVSDMASTKFKQIINRELSQYADSSKSGHQVSDYICKTFLESPANDEEALNSVEERNEPLEEAKQSHKPIQKVSTEPILSRKSRFNNSFGNTSNPGIGSGGGAGTGGTASEIIKEADNDNESEIGDEFNSQSEKYRKYPLGVDVLDVDAVSKILETDINKWGMDLFHFTKLTNNRPLVVLSLAIFKQHNLMNKFQIPDAVLLRFLIQVESKYRPQVSYHNSIHAADVTQSANVLLGCSALENVFSDIEVLSVVIASLIHDMDHPGVTNQYLINTGSSLATLYNDCSVLENHHLATAFSLLANSDCDILTTLSKRHRQSLRRMVIDMVLATDMSKHMNLLADLKTMVETKKVAGSGILSLENYQDRILILQNLLHCADLSNPTKPLPLYQSWTNRIMEEFFMQGDKEREANLEISPMCDRQSASVEKSQVSFIDFIVHPLWETWTELVYPDSQGILETLESNRQWYLSQLESSFDINQSES